MPLLMDHVTVNPAATIPGRININQASATVLLGIPGMTPEIADQIITRRDVDTDRRQAQPPPRNVAPAGRRRHARGDEDDDAVCDGRRRRLSLPGGGLFPGRARRPAGRRSFSTLPTPLPRLLFWRDISHLGRGYAMETLGVDYTEQPITSGE